MGITVRTNGSLRKVWAYIHAERPDLALDELHAVRGKNRLLQQNCAAVLADSKAFDQMLIKMNTAMRQQVMPVVKREFLAAEKLVKKMEQLTRLMWQEEKQEE